MVREGRGRYLELVLNLPDDQPGGVSGKEKADDPKPGLVAEGGESVGENKGFSHNISIIAEI